jgi:hypothetical protein
MSSKLRRQLKPKNSLVFDWAEKLKYLIIFESAFNPVPSLLTKDI